MSQSFDFRWSLRNETDKHFLLSKIRIIDDLLPNYSYEEYNQKYDFLNMRTNYKPDYIGENSLYREIGDQIEKYSRIKLKEINYGDIKSIRTRVYLVSDLSSPFKECLHVDDTNNHEFGYTLSYHWMGDNNSGGTTFYKSDKDDTPLMNIPFRRNRLVIFPARIPHTGYANQGYSCNSKRVIYTLFTVLNSFT